MQKTNNQGFSLVELLVAVAMLGVVSTCVMNTTVDIVEKAESPKVKMAFKKFIKMVEEVKIEALEAVEEVKAERALAKKTKFSTKPTVTHTSTDVL